MAVAMLKESWIFALLAETRACTTLATCPPARKWASRSLRFNGIPALVPSIIALTITPGGTFLKRIRKSCKRLIRTPDTRAENHNPTGTKYKKTISRMIIPAIIPKIPTDSTMLFRF